MSSLSDEEYENESHLLENVKALASSMSNSMHDYRKNFIGLVSQWLAAIHEFTSTKLWDDITTAATDFGDNYGSNTDQSALACVGNTQLLLA